MTMLSPSATFHAELREQLSGVGRALAAQRLLPWLARGLLIGTCIDLGIVVWAWTRELVATLPIPLLAGVPLAVTLVVGIASLFVRHNASDLARRVDRAAQLQERSTTALELGGRAEEYPLALAQMRDAVEHLRRVDLLEVFPPRFPKKELMATGFVALIAVLIGVSPNPWLLRARAANPAITVAREEAQRVDRLAESVQTQDSADLNQLRELLQKGARAIDARSNEPDEALTALEDLEAQIRQMSAGDDQLAAALAAIASALASDPSTQQLSNAINTGDMREISNAARNLAQQTEQLTGQDRQRIAKVLRDASNRAGRASPSVAGELSDAADALEAGDTGGQLSPDAADRVAGSQSTGARSRSDSAQSGRSAKDALNELGNSAASAAERERAQNQLESSRNALERALGRTQSRSAGSNGRSSTGSGQNGHRSNAAGEHGQNTGQTQSGEPGNSGADQGGGSNGGGEEGSNAGDEGEGSGYSTGGQNMNKTGPASSIDSITRPEQVPNSGEFNPDQASHNPYASDAADGASRASDESVQPSYSRKPTEGNAANSIPLGLRDLVKDYFSSLDQK